MIKKFLSILMVLIFIISVLNHNSKAVVREKEIKMAVEFVDHAACAHIARNKGWFKEEGLNITSYENYITGMALAAALGRGSIDVAYICLIPAICAYANGKVPIKVVAGTHKYGYGLLVDYKMIDKYHLDKYEILSEIRRMPPPKILLALKMRQLDAGFCCEQFPTMGEELGFKVLLTAEDLWPYMQGSVLVAREELIKNNPQIVKKIVRVTERATHYINNYPQDASLIVADELQIAGKEVLPLKIGKITAKLKITPEVILKSLTTRMECTTDIDPEQIQKTINYMAKLGYIKKSFKAEEILDLRFLR